MYAPIHCLIYHFLFILVIWVYQHLFRYFLVILPSNNRKSIIAKLNWIRVILAERDLSNKWLSDKLGKENATMSKRVTNTTLPSLEALIAIANALEVPVQELVKQDEFNQEK